MTRCDEHGIAERAVSILWLLALAICPACVGGTAHVRLQPEQDTLLHVGQTAAVRLGPTPLYAIGSGGGSLVLITQLTKTDGSRVYVYRAARIGRRDARDREAKITSKIFATEARGKSPNALRWDAPIWSAVSDHRFQIASSSPRPEGFPSSRANRRARQRADSRA